MSGRRSREGGHWSAPAMGAGGYLAVLIFAIVVSILAQGWRLAIAFAVVLALAQIYFAVGLRVLTNRRFHLFLVIVLLTPALLMDPMSFQLGPVSLSQVGLTAGLHMALRAGTIAVAVTGFAGAVSVGELSRLLEQAGLKGLGFALGVAMNMLPIIKDTATTVYQALRMRGGFRRRRLQAARLLLVTIVVNSLRHADNIVNAAEARAFSVDRIRSSPALSLRHDVRAYVALAVLAAVLLLA